MINANIYRVGLNIGSLCNLRCKYCYEHGGEVIPQTVVSDAHLDRYAKYLHYLVGTLPEGSKLEIGIYGGEPLLQLDKIERFIRSTSTISNRYIITTNGTMVEECADILKRLAKYNKVQFNVSYDYALQDTMRCAGTYDTVRNGIRWLYNEGLCRRTTAVFTYDTIYKFSDVFMDFVELRKELPELILTFNIDKYAPEIPLDFNEEKARAQLAEVEDFLIAYPKYAKSIKYNRACCDKRWEPAKEGCFFRNLLGAMVEDGTMYPAWSMPYYHEKGRELMRLGHIEDDFSTLIENRKALIAKLPPMSLPEDCKDCGINCHITPFQNITESLDQWNQKSQMKGTCNLIRLVHEYIE